MAGGKNTYRSFVDEISFRAGALVAGTKALLTNKKSTGMLLLALGLSACDKTFYDMCDYGKGTFAAHQTVMTTHRSSQGLIELPFLVQGSDIECGTALLEVVIDVYDATTHKYIGTYRQQINNFTNNAIKYISFTANLPTHCRGVEGDITILSDEDPIAGKQSFDLKFSGPYKFDVAN